MAVGQYRLQRVTPKGAAETFGVLLQTDAQVPLFVTLERPDLDDAPNIACIPVGCYTCVRSHSPHLGYVTWEVCNVPGRTGIRIHVANRVEQLEGCIALGMMYGRSNTEPAVLESQVAFDTFMAATHPYEQLQLEISACP